MKMLQVLAVCVVLPLIVADTLKFHPRAGGYRKPKMTNGELELLEKLFLDSHKPTMLKDFVFKSCGGNTKSDFNLTISPDPIQFPGTLNISAAIDLKVEISAPLSVSLDLKKKFLGEWVKVPCVENVGSCTYNGLCTTLASVTCPPQLKSIGCKCPYKARTYRENLSIPVDAAAFISGDFQVTATITFGEDGKYNQCIFAQFSVA